MLNSIAVSLMVLLLCPLKEGWVVSFPVHKCMMARKGKWGGIEWINMGSHPIIFFLRNEAISLNELAIAFVLV